MRNADIEIFLAAARTDAAAPYPQKTYERGARAAGIALPANGHPSTLARATAARIAAEALHTSSDPRAPEALGSWAARPETLPENRREILTVMNAEPRPEYLAAVKAILTNDAIASEPGGTIALGLLFDALGTEAYVSNWERALNVAASIGTEEASAFVKSIAMDQTRTAPDPRIYASFPKRCCEGKKGLVKGEAEALASLRIVALAVLYDEDLLRQIVKNRKEPALVRHWARVMIRGDSRQRADLIDEAAFSGHPVVSPCPVCDPPRNVEEERP